jgi:hypothetical protein
MSRTGRKLQHKLREKNWCYRWNTEAQRVEVRGYSEQVAGLRTAQGD